MQLVWCGVIITIALCANFSISPFQTTFVNRIESLCLTALYITIIMGSQFYLESQNIWSTVVVIAANGFTMIVLFYNLIDGLKSTLPNKKKNDNKVIELDENLTSIQFVN